MMWALGGSGTLVSEKDSRGRYGVLYTGQAVTATQARSGYEGFPYYGFVTAQDVLPRPTSGTGLTSWGTVEEAMLGVENLLARWHAEETMDASTKPG